MKLGRLEQDSIWRWWSITKSTVRPDRIVLSSPHLDHDLCLLQRIEDLSCKQLISHLPIERLNVSILPWASGFDEQRLDFKPAQPGAHFLGGELRAIIRPQVYGDASFTKQLGQHLQNILVSEAACDTHGQTFPSVFIDDVQNAEWIAILGVILHEIIAPDVLGELRSQTDDRAIVEPQTASFGLFGGALSALPAARSAPLACDSLSSLPARAWL